MATALAVTTEQERMKQFATQILYGCGQHVFWGPQSVPGLWPRLPFSSSSSLSHALF